ncbi:glycosyltransferase family 4 protein [Thermolongibacillus altinsuensis]|jgi:UDP-GlcNAc:undecaprenyl-phosphate GlcNAc-1-phosphate transferase|uniref:glycosyltransferase family 4 protein n=1 Tax=Thermolongibacillus altinsuensis TaxID=575256 RepID=UPI00242A3277|nr:MraY family glycosyltransferase [Thermolongibacillus altinsuensis]GMB09149.1 undecaprenyl-phosphate alpha-N-acetylglucosaminyl 1-phosphate transferase [Thermolongibacillus altinsuensis]
MIYFTLLICFIIAVLITPAVKWLAFKVGATDKPNQRKVHQKIMPRLGGLAIFISFMIGYWILKPESPFATAILIGAAVVVLTGVLDDIYELPPKLKLLGQIIAAVVVVVYGGVRIEYINLPFGGQLDFGILSIPITMFWIIGITNAINLIDGLDGLAAGVSSIALVTIASMAATMSNTYAFVFAMSLILLGSTLGFLIYNFHPAKIFMGDTGALFLGYMISVLSLLGFKNVTVFSFVIPILILGVPISDTFFAIIRRIVNKQPLSAPDKSHLHHCLLRLGYSHRQTVLIIYGMAAMFGLAAVLLSKATMFGSLFVITVIVLIVELIVEKVGLVSKDYRPLLKIVRGMRGMRRIS